MPKKFATEYKLIGYFKSNQSRDGDEALSNNNSTQKSDKCFIICKAVFCLMDEKCALY